MVSQTWDDHVPEEGKVLTLSKKTEGVEVPMEEFLQFTKIPIIIYTLTL